jgi:dTDP-D-glucose 4,6-dehydratase
VRIFNTYGPRLQLNDGRVISNFMKQALRGEPLTIFGDGSQTRSFCYVSDEIHGILRLSRSDEHLPVNIGNPVEFTMLECSKIILKVTGSKSEITFRPLPEDDPKQRKPDITKAKKLLGWEPKIELETGLRLRWIISRRLSRKRLSPSERTALPNVTHHLASGELYPSRSGLRWADRPFPTNWFSRSCNCFLVRLSFLRNSS